MDKYVKFFKDFFKSHKFYFTVLAIIFFLFLCFGSLNNVSAYSVIYNEQEYYIDDQWLEIIKARPEYTSGDYYFYSSLWEGCWDVYFIPKDSLGDIKLYISNRSRINSTGKISNIKYIKINSSYEIISDSTIDWRFNQYFNTSNNRYNCFANFDIYVEIGGNISADIALPR